ncbi:MAG: ATP-binding cassette domain-containing protein [bacterium]
MIQLTVDSAVKDFGRVRAVDRVSLEAGGGEVFALLGPNGAGKTTLIRMIMDITRPDSGAVRFDGRPIGEDIKHRIGYLPEERGLYLKQKVAEVVAHFGRLHGLGRSEARERTREWLHRVDLGAWGEKNVEDLSKGMQQKAQLALTLLHDPDLVILDEPFSGLDPVNTRMVKDFILEMKQQGKTVVLSTHQMAQVEAVADRVFMISRGHRVLYGTLKEIKQEHSDNAVLVNPGVDASGVEGVVKVGERAEGELSKVWLEEGVEPRTFLNRLLERRAPVEHYELAETPLEEIFVKMARDTSRPEEGGVS